MSYTQPPCVCGGTKFMVLPEVSVHYGNNVDISHRWTVTMVVCQQCTRTETFTQNADRVAAHVKGARMIEAGVQ